MSPVPGLWSTMPIWTTTISTVTAVGQFYKTNTTTPVIWIGTSTIRAQVR